MVTEKIIHKILGIESLIRQYHQLEKPSDPAAFIDATLEYLNIRYTYNEQDLDRISSSGPTVVIANHPFGGIEGLIMARLLLAVRNDVKILANPFLKVFKELSPLMYYTNPDKNQQAYQDNIRATKNAYQWLKKGGVLAIFPAGNVSHITWNRWKVRDREWSPSFVRMIRKTNANVVPLYFHGRNSRLFLASGLIHPKLRTIQLARELLNKRNTTIQVSIGKKISHRKIPFELNDQEITSYFRFRTYTLGKKIHEDLEKKPMGAPRKIQPQTPIFHPITPHLGTYELEQEIKSLPPTNTLVQTRDLSVHFTTPQQSQRIMHEIGRLREKAFRHVGCSMGKTIDIDAYDDHYVQLFLWNKPRKEMVGGYRIGHSDEIIENQGIDGLYTRRNFIYDASLIHSVGPALELGRSFVRPKYQKDYKGLMLLWKGIGQYILQNPKYHTLFGNVSTSNRYSNFSKYLIMDYIKQYSYDVFLSKHVMPTNPPMGDIQLEEIEKSLLYTFVQEIDDVSEMISDYELSYDSVPVLLKQYLKLGGRIAGFNIDEGFGNSLESFMFVDLRKTPQKTMEFYMTPEGYRTFHKNHCEIKNPNIQIVA